MLVQSLKTPQEDVFGNPLIVVNPTLENFEELFERKSEVRGFVGTRSAARTPSWTGSRTPSSSSPARWRSPSW